MLPDLSVLFLGDGVGLAAGRSDRRRFVDLHERYPLATSAEYSRQLFVGETQFWIRRVSKHETALSDGASQSAGSGRIGSSGLH